MRRLPQLREVQAGVAVASRSPAADFIVTSQSACPSRRRFGPAGFADGLDDLGCRGFCLDPFDVQQRGTRCIRGQGEDTPVLSLDEHPALPASAIQHGREISASVRIGEDRHIVPPGSGWRVQLPFYRAREHRVRIPPRDYRTSAFAGTTNRRGSWSYCQFSRPASRLRLRLCRGKLASRLRLWLRRGRLTSDL
jgi:hypothetical protein